MEFVSQIASDYCNKYTSTNDDFLLNIHNYVLNNHSQKHLQSSWVQGMFLKFISQIQQPKTILEIGTFTGFSTLCLANGLQENGEIHTIELRENDANFALTNFKQSPQKNQIHLHCGNALNIIPTLKKTWDLVFIDADKTAYIEYYNLVKNNLSKNGLIIADNVLFHGQVFEQNLKGKNAKAIHNFNEYVANDKSVEQVMLTVRDGLTLIKLKS